MGVRLTVYGNLPTIKSSCAVVRSDSGRLRRFQQLTSAMFSRRVTTDSFQRPLPREWGSETGMSGGDLGKCQVATGSKIEAQL
jgi:hypothetical protein